MIRRTITALVVLAGAAYTEGQARSQVSMLLAEAEGYQTSLADLRKVKRQAEEQMKALAVKISASESQLAALSTQRELLRARQLTAEGEQLLAQVDDLMTGNTRLIEGNPVRTVRELLETAPTQSGKRTSNSRVDAFLSGSYTPVQANSVPASRQGTEQIVAKPVVASGKPIFEQK